MSKPLMKEICVLLLLSIAILLILGIVFYNYIPISVTISSKEEYQTPEEVQNEINDSTADSLKTEITYEITDADLSDYQEQSDYSEGKTDPFSLD